MKSLRNALYFSILQVIYKSNRLKIASLWLIYKRLYNMPKSKVYSAISVQPTTTCTFLSCVPWNTRDPPMEEHSIKSFVII